MTAEDQTLYADFFKKAPEMLCIVGFDGLFKHLNSAWEKALGFTSAEMLGKPLLDFAHPEDRGTAEAAFRKILAGESEVSYETRFRCKGGTHRWLLWRCASDPVKTLFHGVVVDITSRRLIETALKESQESLRHHLENIPIALGIRDQNGDLRFINSKFTQAFGYTAEEIFSIEDWARRAYPDPVYRKESFEQWNRSFEAALGGANGEIPPGEYNITCKDGSVKTINLYGLVDAKKDILCMFEDTTQRAQAAKALRESSETLRKILDLAPMSMAIVNMDGTIEYINRKAVQTFGFLHEDIPTMDKWWILAYPDETYRKEVVDRWMGRVHKAFAENTEIDGGEYLVTCKDGSVKNAFIFGMIAANKVFVMFDDITRRVAAEKALRESEAALGKILDNAPMAMAIHDRTGKVDYVNKKFTQTFGYAREDVPDKDTWALRVAPDETYRKELMEKWTGFIRKAAATNGEIEGAEYRITCKDGKVKTMFIFGVLAAGKAVVMFDDITRRVEAERELRESESRYRALVETTGTGYVIINKEGRVLDANTEYVRLTGRKDLKEVLGRSVLEWTADYEKEKNAAAVEKCARDGYILNFEVDYCGADGRITPIEINANVVTRGGVPQILTLCRDISARRRTEAEIRNLNQNLELRVRERAAELTAANEELVTEIAQRLQVERAKDKLQEQLLQSQKLEAVGRLAGGIAHDFNNILVSISGYAELLLDTMPTGAPARADLSEILLETERGAALTHQLLTFSTKQEIKLEVLDINGIAAGSEKMLKRLIGANMHLETRLAPELCQVKADPGQISQIIVNLVINARDAMPDGGRIIMETRNAELGGEDANMRLIPAPGSYAELSVSDTGGGMTPQTLSHLFEPFYTTKKPGQGTGLGLSTVYGIVSHARGGIYVESAPGRGTTMKIYLPRA